LKRSPCDIPNANAYATDTGEQIDRDKYRRNCRTDRTPEVTSELATMTERQ